MRGTDARGRSIRNPADRSITVFDARVCDSGTQELQRNYGGHMISLDEALLLLRGWEENKFPLRVAVQSPEVWFSGFCTVKKVEGDRVEFWIGGAVDQDGIGFLVASCRFEFEDVPLDAPDSLLPVGAKVESGLVGTRDNFKIAILALAGG
jgi:hypothetical protein